MRERTERGEAIYELDEDALRELEPDLIVTQALCAVCAVAYDDVARSPRRCPTRRDVISLDPHTLGEVLGDVRTLAEATGRSDAGVDARAATRRRGSTACGSPCASAEPAAGRRARVARSRLRRRPLDAAADRVRRRRATCSGCAGEHSARREWEEVAAAEPEVVVVMPCGYDAAPRRERGRRSFADRLGPLGAERVVAVDAAALLLASRPAPDRGLEELAHVLHPVLVPEPEGGARAIELAGLEARR